MICCGLERDSKFCPKCGKNLEAKPDGPLRWATVEQQGEMIAITLFPDRHRIPATRVISRDEAAMLANEIMGILAE